MHCHRCSPVLKLSTALIMTILFPDRQLLTTLDSGLSEPQKQVLQSGKTVICGQAGKYVAQILVHSEPETAWQVLTDFSNLAKFLPNVIATKVLEASKYRTVVEQTNISHILFAQIQSRVCTENVVTGPGKIDFHLLEGDLDQLHGSWQVLPLFDPIGHVLVQQVVAADANIGLLKGSFHIVFRETLKRTLTAIQQETQRRQAVLCAA